MSEILGTLFKYILASLGVVAVVWIFYTALGSDKANTTVSQLAQVQSSVQALYTTQPSFGTLSNSVAINANLVPREMVSGTNLVNAWNGSVTLSPESSNAQFSVTQSSVPKAACIKVATSAGAYLGLQINGGSTYTASAAIDPGAASTECAAGGENNTLKFFYGR